MDTQIEKPKRSNPNSPITLINEIRDIKQLRDKVKTDVDVKREELDSVADEIEKFCVEQEIKQLEVKIEKLESRIQRKMNRIKKLNQTQSAKADRSGSPFDDSQVGNNDA